MRWMQILYIPGTPVNYPSNSSCDECKHTSIRQMSVNYSGNALCEDYTCMAVFVCSSIQSAINYVSAQPGSQSDFSRESYESDMVTQWSQGFWLWSIVQSTIIMHGMLMLGGLAACSQEKFEKWILEVLWSTQ